METSTDRILGNRLQLMQPAEGYRAAIDPVLLAAAIPATSGARVLDLGCGVGTAGLCLAARVPGVAIVGLDLQPALIALAGRNAAANGLADRTVFRCGDLLTFDERGFDHVLVNPPYLPRDRASISPNPIKAMANVEGAARLADWVRVAIATVAPDGTVTFIHRADRAVELVGAMQAGLGDLKILHLLPRAGQPPKRVLVQGVRGAAARTRAAEWVLHAADGSFTAETESVLRDAAALPIADLPLTAPRGGR